MIYLRRSRQSGRNTARLHVFIAGAALGIMFGLSMTLTRVIAVKMMAEIVLLITTQNDLNKMLLYAACCVVCYCILYLLAYLELTIRTRSTHYFWDRYSLNVLQHFFKGDPNQVLRINKSNFAYYANELSRNYIETIFSYLQSVCSSIVAIICYLVLFNDVVPCEFVLFIAIIYLIITAITRKLKDMISETISSLISDGTRVNTLLNEMIDNSENIILSGIIEGFSRRLRLLMDKMRDSKRRIARLNMLTRVVANVPMLLIQILLFVYIQWKVNKSGAIEQFFVIQSITPGIFACFIALLDARIDRKKQSAQRRELDNALDIEIFGQHEPGEKTEGLRTVMTQNLCYDYGRERIAYPDMVFRSNITLVHGTSGSGKTTLLRMIAGFLLPARGKIIFETDDHQQGCIDVGLLRIAYMPQTCYIFDETIRYNVTLGEAYSDDQIIDAMKFANAYEILMSAPQGLDLKIRADTISGGERQRIALARSLIRKPELLLLDESFAHLDEENCRSIVANLKELSIICIVSGHNSWLIHDKSIHRIGLGGPEDEIDA